MAFFKQQDKPNLHDPNRDEFAAPAEISNKEGRRNLK